MRFYVLGPFVGSEHYNTLQAGGIIPDSWIVPTYVYDTIDEVVQSWRPDLGCAISEVRRVGTHTDDRGRILVHTLRIAAVRTVTDGDVTLDILPESI